MGYERKKERCRQEGTRINRDGSKGIMDRMRKKVMGKNTWYQNKKIESQHNKKAGNREANTKKSSSQPASIMFIQRTKGGKLVKRLREAEERLAPSTARKVKIVEKPGTKLGDKTTKADP